MELFEYIKSQLPQMPNSAIMKQLGASQELIDYVKKTPENTNFAIAEVIEGSGSGDAEVWFVGSEYSDKQYGREFSLSNVGDVDHAIELYNNPDKYLVFLNNELLPYRIEPVQSLMLWGDTISEETQTKSVSVDLLQKVIAWFADIATAPTSVEVSVKAK